MAVDLIELIQQKLKSLHPPAVPTSTVINIKSSAVISDKEHTENIENVISTSPKHTQASKIIRNTSFKTPLVVHNHIMSSNSTNRSVTVKNKSNPTKDPATTVLKEHHLNSLNGIHHNDPNIDEGSPRDYDLRPESQVSNEIEEITRGLMSKFGQLNDKIDSMINRLENVENKVQSIKYNPVSSSAPELHSHSSDPINNMSQKLDNLSNRFALLENEVLILKEKRRRQSEINNDMTLNNDTTAYETPFHSFLNISSQNTPERSELKINSSNLLFANQLNGQLKNHSKTNGIEQGIACDLETMNDNFDDLSLNSNDSTPTIIHNNTAKQSKLSSANSESDIQRAKELVSRATQLNQVLSTQLKI